jgi:autotransporter-associated beta strand protein
LTKAGAGQLVFSNPTNDYQGETTILAGSVRLTKTMGTSPPAGDGRLGDPTALTNRINLSGGNLQYNGSQVLATDPRTLIVPNRLRLTADSSITYETVTANLGTVHDITFEFSHDDISGTGGTLTFRNDGACTSNSSTCVFRPTFSGVGFDFGQPVVISNHTTVASRSTVLTSANTTGDQTWSNVLSGTGGFRRNAVGGRTILTGNNTYAGGTLVDAGTLLVNNTTGSGTGTGAVTVNSTGVLGGTGALTGAVTVNAGGSLAPGTSLESLDVGAVTFNTGSFAAELDSSLSAAVGADLLNVNGALSIIAGSTLSLTDLGAAVLTPGTKYTLLSYSGAWDNGVFDLVPDDSTVVVGSNSFTINYNDTSGGTNFGGGLYTNYVTLTSLPPGLGSGAQVPEPAGVALLLVGLAAMHGVRRQR